MCVFKVLSLSFSFCPDKSENGEAYQRKKAVAADLPESPAAPVPSQGNLVQPGGSSWRRIALLILAITIHNIPGEAHPKRSSHPSAGEGKGGLGNRDVGPFSKGWEKECTSFLSLVFGLLVLDRSMYAKTSCFSYFK